MTDSEFWNLAPRVRNSRVLLLSFTVDRHGRVPTVVLSPRNPDRDTSHLQTGVRNESQEWNWEMSWTQRRKLKSSEYIWFREYKDSCDLLFTLYRIVRTKSEGPDFRLCQTRDNEVNDTPRTKKWRVSSLRSKTKDVKDTLRRPLYGVVRFEK